MEYMLRISLCVDVHAQTIIIYIKNCLVCEIESNCRSYFAARKCIFDTAIGILAR